jgi:hypothetical protein
MLKMDNDQIIGLNNIDPDDIDDVLKKIEQSFGFRFEAEDLKEVKTFGALCDVITQKIAGKQSSGCSTQQAFYKLRQAIAATQRVNPETITPKSNLESLFPRHNRRKQIKALAKEMGISIDILRPKHFVSGVLIMTFIGSAVVLFFKWKWGLAGIILSLIGLKVALLLGKECDLKTTGQLARKVSREQYLQTGQEPETFNPSEVRKKVEELFIEDLHLPPSALRKEATF